MSQAAELLASLEEYYPTHDHNVSDPDSYFIIDPDTRQISNLSQSPNVLMQNDHNSEVYTFEIPRFVEGHDMLSCDRVRIHYINVGRNSNNKHTDVYEMSDLRINPSNPGTLISTWTIKRQATQYPGSLSFVIQYLCIDESITDEETSNISYEWHTDIYKGIEIRETINNSEEAVVDYTDILEEWHQRLFGMEDSITAAIVAEANVQKAAIEAIGRAVLESLPEDYTATNGMANEALRKKANTIEGVAEGKSVFVDDSADAYLLGLNLFGKTIQVKTTGAQLANFADGDLNTGVSATFENDVLTVNGDGTAPYQNCGVDITSIFVNNPGKILYFTFESIKTTYTMDGRVVQLNIKKADDSWKYEGLLDKNLAHSSYTIPVDVSDISSVSVCVYTTNAATSMANKVIITKPMLQFGTTTKEYEQYSRCLMSPSPEYPQELNDIASSGHIGVKVSGKNLCPPNAFDNMSMNGTTSAYNPSTHTITMTAASVGNPGCYCQPCKGMVVGEPYTMSFDIRGSAGKKVIAGWDKKKASITLTDAYVRYSVTLVATRSAEPVIFYSIATDVGGLGVGEYMQFANVQIEFGDVATEYDEYKEMQSIRPACGSGLPGVPVSQNGNYTDENGQQWACDEIDFKRGVYVRRIEKYVVTGDENWAVSGVQVSIDGHTRFDYSVGGDHAAYFDCLCTHVPFRGANPTTGMSAWVNNAINLGYRLQLPYETVSELTEFLTTQYAAGTPLTFYHVLSNPVETQLTSDEIAEFKQLKSNYRNTSVSNDAGAHMAVKYNVDTKAYVDGSIKASVTDVLEAIKNGAY